MVLKTCVRRLMVHPGKVLQVTARPAGYIRVGGTRNESAGVFNSRSRCGWNNMSTALSRYYPRTPDPTRRLLTLRPENMRPTGQGVSDISGSKMPKFYGPGFSEGCQISYCRDYHGTRKLRQPYPPNTQGVLYFHHVPGDAEASQLRFRICPDIVQFDTGFDLQLPNGMLWNMPLKQIWHAKYTQGLLRFLGTEFDLDASTKNVHPPWVNRRILTLRPENMARIGQEIFDLSGYLLVHFHCLESKPVTVEEGTITFKYLQFQGRDLPFPPNTRGVFYYHHIPGNETASLIRFRICTDIAQFDTGSDLQLPDGTVWARSLFVLSRNERYENVIPLLNKEFLSDYVNPAADFLSRHRSLVTLSPEKMTDSNQDILDLSGLNTAVIHVLGDKDATASTPESARSFGYYSIKDSRPFPPQTKGFIYYARQSASFPHLGELRFRKCDDAASFAKGTDLCTKRGKPLSLPFENLVRHYPVLCDLLVQEGLADKDYVERFQVADLPTIVARRALFSLSQPFIVDFDQIGYTLSLVMGTRSARIYFILAPVETGVFLPYKGRAVVSLEISTLPRHAAQGLTLVLRFLEFLDPPKRRRGELTATIALPKVGHLHGVLYSRRKVPIIVPWSLSLRKYQRYAEVCADFDEHSTTSYFWTTRPTTCAT